MHNLLRPIAFAAAGVAIIAACGDPTGSGNNKPPPVEPPPVATPSITGATLTAGAEGVLVGTNLDKLPATATVDGASVTFTTRNAGEARFPMPPAQACEVDGRAVALTVGTTTRAEPLRVPTRLSMQVGETRTLDVSATSCVQLPADGSGYVLTALHPALTLTYEESDAPETFFTVQTLTGSGTSASMAPMQMRGGVAAAPHNAPQLNLTAAPGEYSDNPIQFDPRYATASVGDKVTFVDFSRAAADVDFCDKPRDQIPTYEVQIIAVAGKTVVGLDLRTANATNLLTPEVAAIWQKAAQLAEPVTLPTMRIIFDAAFEPTRGGDGRRYMLLTDKIPSGVGLAGDGTSQPQSLCQHTSEMSVMRFGVGNVVPVTSNVSRYASLLVHEFAHLADEITVRRSGYTGQRGPFLTEAIASEAEETATRLSTGKMTDARLDQVARGEAPNPDSHFSGFWGTLPNWTPFKNSISPRRDGTYAHGATMILYAREKAGQTVPGFTGPTLYQQMNQRRAWDMPALASLVGMTPEAFHAEWALAHATDGLTAPGAAVPQFATWDLGEGGTKLPAEIARAAPQRFTLAAAPGNYAALYFTTFKTDNKARGISFRATDVVSSRATVRLTRIR